MTNIKPSKELQAVMTNIKPSKDKNVIFLIWKTRNFILGISFQYLEKELAYCLTLTLISSAYNIQRLGGNSYEDRHQGKERSITNPNFIIKLRPVDTPLCMRYVAI